LTICRAWQKDEIVYESQLRTHEGSLWQALKDTAQLPGHADWICLATAGIDGAGINPRGLYQENHVYRRLDLVTVNGSTFVAKRDDPGTCPGEHWQLTASQGKRGIAGEKGERGPVGPKGEAGQAAPRITGFRVDRKNYRAVARMSDGTELPLDLRELFEQFHSETD
jgi:hypothetical protein